MNLSITHNGEHLRGVDSPGAPARGDVIILTPDGSPDGEPPTRWVVERVEWTVDDYLGIVRVNAIVQPVEMP